MFCNSSLVMRVPREVGNASTQHRCDNHNTCQGCQGRSTVAMTAAPRVALVETVVGFRNATRRTKKGGRYMLSDSDPRFQILISGDPKIACCQCFWGGKHATVCWRRPGNLSGSHAWAPVAWFFGVAYCRSRTVTSDDNEPVINADVFVMAPRPDDVNSPGY